MTDEQMADYLGFPGDDPRRIEAVQRLEPKKRALFERVAEVEMEVKLWLAGVGPKPQGVLIDLDRSARSKAVLP